MELQHALTHGVHSAGVVCRHNHRRPHLVNAVEQRQDVGTGVWVKVAGGLVGKKN